MSNFIEPGAPEIIVKLPDLTWWTRERFEKAKKLFLEGSSYSEIAVKLHTTRNAVCGKLIRNGVYRGGKRVVGTRTYKKRPGGYAMRAQAFERRKEIWQGVELTDLPIDGPDNPVTIVQLKDHHCRWPCLGSGAVTLFCGGEAFDRLPYCARHCRVAYQFGRRI